MGGAFDVPVHLQNPTGLWYLDVIPLATVLPCLPTLQLYWKNRRYSDLLLYSLGFLVAIAYHICQMNPEGLEAARLLAIAGIVWRKWDIVMAMICLARTVGHVVGGCRHSTLVLPNAVFPACIIILMNLFPRTRLHVVGVVGLCTVLGTVMMKVALEGAETFPKYRRPTQLRVPCWFFLGFVCFFMPTAMPTLYWFWHSWWHVFIACGYYELYKELDRTGKLRAVCSSKSSYGKMK